MDEIILALLILIVICSCLFAWSRNAALKRWFGLILLLLCNLVLLEIIRMMTVAPDARDGNGNPAFLFYLPAIYFIFKFCKSLFKALTDWPKWSRKGATGLMMIGLLVFGCALWQQILFAATLISEISQSGLSTPQKQNTLYFNYWNFLICIGLTFVLAGLKIRRKF
jgi:Ca2+/Na+ antiporter